MNISPVFLMGRGIRYADVHLYSKLQTNLMRKTDYHRLATHISANDIDPEITEKLDAIVAVAQRAQPVGSLQ